MNNRFYLKAVEAYRVRGVGAELLVRLRFWIRAGRINFSVDKLVPEDLVLEYVATLPLNTWETIYKRKASRVKVKKHRKVRRL